MKSGIAFNNNEELKYKAEDQVQVKEVIRLPMKVTLLQSKAHQKSITHSNIKTQLFATHIIHSQQEPSRVPSVETDLENERRKTR